jgi:lysine decarboxylase
MGVPLVVDQAWGAHLDFLPGRGAMELGADVSVTSIHKALMGYSQTAVINMRDGRVTRAHLDRCVDLVSTTSPSGTLFASIDATRAVLEREGEAAMDRTLGLVRQMRRRLARVPGLVVLDEHNVDCLVDPFKVTLVLPGTGVSGLDIARDLWDIGHGPEVADRDTLVLSITLMDEPTFLLEMADMIAGFIEAHRDRSRPATPLAVWRVEPEVVVTPREAFFAKRRRIPLVDAAGEVSAEQFCPYPPGVPLLAPGERVTEQTIQAIRAAGRVGRVAYSSDATLETIEIIDAL